MNEQVRAKIEAIRSEAAQKLPHIRDWPTFQNFKAKLLGRQGALTALLKNLGTCDPAERPHIGKQINQVKQEIEAACDRLQRQLEERARAAALAKEAIDPTLPGLVLPRGHRHPLRQAAEAIESIFLAMGFSIYEGPEVETDYYNFEALNFPAEHPARDMQDTFYIGGIAAPSGPSGERAGCGPHPPKPLGSGTGKAGASPLLLRTHTSPVQIRVMEKHKPPLAMIAPGAVYRHDDDVTHSPMFHQVEGLMVDTEITFGDLKGVLETFCHRMFGMKKQVRFRPSFFPFVEPGAEVDIACALCNGRGCRVCGGDGWLEILGAGMVHPAVFEKVGIDPKKFSGFAFGMGVERIAMLKYGIDDIRLFYESDLRFLEQF